MEEHTKQGNYNVKKNYYEHSQRNVEQEQNYSCSFGDHILVWGGRQWTDEYVSKIISNKENFNKEWNGGVVWTRCRWNSYYYCLGS